MNISVKVLEFFMWGRLWETCCQVWKTTDQCLDNQWFR